MSIMYNINLLKKGKGVRQLVFIVNEHTPKISLSGEFGNIEFFVGPLDENGFNYLFTVDECFNVIIHGTVYTERQIINDFRLCFYFYSRPIISKSGVRVFARLKKKNPFFEEFGKETLHIWYDKKVNDFENSPIKIGYGSFKKDHRVLSNNDVEIYIWVNEKVISSKIMFNSLKSIHNANFQNCKDRF